jgi:hypothetical protein
MTTSRGAAAPHTLPAASGREQHVRDSPVILGCARTLAAVRHLQAWHLASSASGEHPALEPLPRLGTQYLSHIHLPSCGALLFIPYGLRPWTRSWFSTCPKRPDWPQLGKRLVDAQMAPHCTVMAGRHRAASEWPSPACSCICLSPSKPRSSARLHGGSESTLTYSLLCCLQPFVALPAQRLLAGLARAVRGLRQRVWGLSWSTNQGAHADVREVAWFAHRHERGCVARAHWRPVLAASWATFGDGTLPCVVWVVRRRHEATVSCSLCHETVLEPLSSV